MSIIHDALRQQAGPAVAGRVPPRASWWSRRAPVHRGGLLVIAGALIAAPLVLLLVPRGERTAADASGAATFLTATDDTPRMPANDIDTDVRADVAMADPATAAQAAGDTPTTPAEGDFAAPPPLVPPPATDTVADARPAAPVDVPPPADPAHGLAGQATAAQEGVPPTPPPATTVVANAAPSSAPPPIAISVERRTASGGDAATRTSAQGDGAVQAAIGAVEAAIASADIPGSQQALRHLESLLPAESLTLLRMRAWVAHTGNDMATAEQQYRQIIERVPDDLNAGVNIALLDARRGDIDHARHRLMRLAGRHVRSPLVARALAELDALPQ